MALIIMSFFFKLIIRQYNDTQSRITIELGIAVFLLGFYAALGIHAEK
ncbi:hypothetical protein [Sphingobacterium siyangense]